MVSFLAQYLFDFSPSAVHFTLFPLFFFTLTMLFKHVIQTCMSKVKIKTPKEEWILKEDEK